MEGADSAQSTGTSKAWSCRTRDVVLVSLLVQTTSIVLLMRYSKTRPTEGPTYRATAAVLMAELLKLPFCVAMTVQTVGSLRAALAVIAHEVVGNFRDTLKCSVPAIAFTMQSNLLFIALANLEAPTYQVTYQSKTVCTAIFSRLLLGRQLKQSQWMAVLLLCLGGVLVSDLRGGAKRGESGQQSFAAGIAAVLSAAVLSSSSSVYFEMMLKKPSVSTVTSAASLWLRNIQLGCFAIPLSAAAMWLNDGEFLTAHGWLCGFDGVVWLIVLLNGLGGLLVAATMKYADNVVKCFAAALAIVSGTLLSVPIFGFALSPMFAFGFACTVSASVLYSSAPDWSVPCWRREYALVPTNDALST